jgi:hypothetical protein
VILTTILCLLVFMIFLNLKFNQIRKDIREENIALRNAVWGAVTQAKQGK